MKNEQLEIYPPPLIPPPKGDSSPTIATHHKANGLAATAHGTAMGHNPIDLECGREPTSIETVGKFRP